MRKSRTFTAEFKREVVEELLVENQKQTAPSQDYSNLVCPIIGVHST
jgi:transposase-like protein